jgi:hypothetical protein
MFTKFVHHPTSFRRRTLVIAVALMAPLASLGVVSPALGKKPTGDFAVFSDCPLSTPKVQCIYSTTTSGEVKLGKTAVPISKTVVLQGGVIENEATGEESFVGAADGNTLVKTALPVPGGLLGLVKCNEINNFIERIACELIFENGVTGVTATTELAAPATSIGINEGNVFLQTGTGLSLPVKVKLDNPFLGGECYIGSNASPVVLNLTTGTTNPPLPNKPITGSGGKLEFKDEGEFGIDRGLRLVDNSFAAPAAKGCGGQFSFLIDPIINAKVGLPAAAGNNTAILSDPLQVAGGEAVKASEE